MKKILVIAVFGFALVAATAGMLVFRGSAARESPSPNLTVEVSAKTAEALQKKIDAVKEAEDKPDHGGSIVELSDAELESYVLYSLAEDIPAKIDSIDVRLGQDTIGADTQITFNSNSTGNTVVDALIGGTHNLSVKGKFAGSGSRGKFDLQEVHVDGIPVPAILIQTLVNKYVKPKYPDVDLKEPFDLPYGIEEIKLDPGKATIVY